jgi:hypothetical protein
MARLKIGLANAENNTDQIVLEIHGSNDWVKELLPCVHGLLDSIAEHAPFDLENAGTVAYELRNALEAAEQGESYAGTVVATEITITQLESQLITEG